MVHLYNNDKLTLFVLVHVSVKNMQKILVLLSTDLLNEAPEVLAWVPSVGVTFPNIFHQRVAPSMFFAPNLSVM